MYIVNNNYNELESVKLIKSDEGKYISRLLYNSLADGSLYEGLEDLEKACDNDSQKYTRAYLKAAFTAEIMPLLERLFSTYKNKFYNNWR